MKRVFKILFLILILTGSVSVTEGKSRIIPAGGKFDTRFLIVVDKLSYDAALHEIWDYKKVLEKEGLGVVILVGEWSNPDILRGEIKKIYKKRPVLEGAVFIGDIPVVRVRNFQHATTAFKMDEENFPITESSVTSDRFYDDLDLEFEFFKVDESNPRHFYYNLKESSPQKISSEFYSARMLPPTDLGSDPHLLLRRYLRRVVEAHKDVNYADRLVIFNGHGYNSDCLTVWQNQQFAIKEQFPQAFRSSKGNGFYNFRQDPFMKFKLYERMQREGTDLFVFHKHGAFDTQYVNGDIPAQNMLGFIPGKRSNRDAMGAMEVMSISTRNIYRRYKGDRALSFKESMIADYGLTEDFFSPEVLDSTRVSDSLFSANINIVLSDLKELKPRSKITIFDACYNGSFHQSGYVAGYHIFGEGETIVTQGNTVNVLQDKWSMELIGMLAEGARVGFWQKEIQTLESHLIGDPTYRFIAGSKCDDRASEGFKLNRDLALNAHDTKVWMEYLKSENPNYQSIALKQLSKNPPPGYSDLLLKRLKESNFSVVRMQALRRLLDLSDKNLTQALLIGLEDPYELIRRNAARFSGFCGDPILISPLVNTLLFSGESQRVQFTVQGSLTMFDADEVIKESERVLNGSSLLNPQKILKDVSDYYLSENKRYENNLRTILDKGAEQARRINAIRSLRNYNNHKQANALITLLKDNSDDTKVRVVLAEALGWFNWSINKNDIIKALEEVYNNKATATEVKAEVLQSILRLK
ncbi:MAG: HEAT repeat domain-containing protein [Bacteroidales bacterium]|nr:HEAT repeat domain-containing protein [Bacteroidales bacterium]